MLDAFASVGADHFDASRIGMDGNKVAFRPDLTAPELKRLVPTALESAERAKDNS